MIAGSKQPPGGRRQFAVISGHSFKLSGAGPNYDYSECKVEQAIIANTTMKGEDQYQQEALHDKEFPPDVMPNGIAPVTPPDLPPHANGDPQIVRDVWENIATAPFTIEMWGIAYITNADESHLGQDRPPSDTKTISGTTPLFDGELGRWSLGDWQSGGTGNPFKR